MVPKPNSEKSLYVCFSLRVLWIWQLRWSSLHTLVVYHKSILILNFSKYATCKSASKSITLAPHCHQMSKHLWNPAQQASFPAFTVPCTSTQPDTEYMYAVLVIVVQVWGSVQPFRKEAIGPVLFLFVNKMILCWDISDGGALFIKPRFDANHEIFLTYFIKNTKATSSGLGFWKYLTFRESQNM